MYLGFDKFPEEFLVGGTEIVFISNLHSILSQHLHTFGVCQNQTENK